MNTTGILNFIPIDDRTATCGQPTPAQFEALAAERYEAVINLAPANPARPDYFDEAALLGRAGLDYLHIPVIWTEPREGDFADFMRAMLALEGKKVLVHCVMNLRATAFYSLFAMKRRGWSVEAADALMLPLWAARPEYQQGGVWRMFVETARAKIAREP